MVETKFKIIIFLFLLFRSAESEESLSDLDTSRRNSVEEEQVSKRFLKTLNILAYFQSQKISLLEILLL
jgi:hypothetical protein